MPIRSYGYKLSFPVMDKVTLLIITRYGYKLRGTHEKKDCIIKH